jgi:hypothetical protein
MSKQTQKNEYGQDRRREPLRELRAQRSNPSRGRSRVHANLRLPRAIAGLCLAVCLVCLALAGCAGGEAGAKTYVIRAEGVAAASGVLCYAGLEMNVYQDFAANPCGDCEDQPVSIYAGADAGEVVAAMAEAVGRADDLWLVKDVDGQTLVLEEKTPGSVSEEPELSGVEGLRLEGELQE